MSSLLARTPLSIRVATMEDLPFMDGLQKKQSRALGFFPRAQMRGYVESQWVLIAEDAGGRPIGYCASRDRYLKRDELGILYQLCVEPGHQRGLVGASLIQAVFDRSAYGCRLYCCWCAQDLEANYFWESLGFVPIAFRGGSGKKKRVHIFWQKRVREGDTSTPWWFPAKTDQGAMRADRIVLPIPPGLHWSEEMPVLEPVAGTEPAPRDCNRKSQVADRKSAPAPTSRAPMQFGPPGTKPPAPVEAPPVVTNPSEKPTRPPRAKQVVDPKLVAAARELRDRYLERVNEHPALLVGSAKYAVTRAIAAPPAQTPLLPAA